MDADQRPVNGQRADRHGDRLMSRAIRDAVRRLRRNLGFSLFAVAMLGVGVGLNTSFFSIVQQVLIAPLPIPGSERVLMLSQHNPRLGTALNSVSPAGYLALAQGLRTINPIAAFQAIELTTIDDEQEPHLVRAARVTPSFFRVISARPLRGRTLAQEDFGPASQYSILDHGNAVFVSERLWREAFGARENLVGGSVFLDGRRVTVVGIASEGFDFPIRTDVWVPLLFGDRASVDWGSFRLGVIGRIESGRSLVDAQLDANGVAELFWDAVPAINDGLTFPLSTVKERLVRDLRPSLVALFVLASTVLLVICTNLASLFLVSGVMREREFAIRVANGATPGDLIVQLIGEMAVIVALASVLALSVGAFGLSVLNSVMPDAVSSNWSLHLDLRSLVFCLVISTTAGALTVLWPARRATRLDLAARLSGLGTMRHSKGQHRTHTVFVAAQVALAIVIGTATWIVSDTYMQFRSADHGFEPEGVAVAELTLPRDRYPLVAEQSAFLQSVLDRVEESLGVSSVAATIRLPVVDMTGGVYVRPPDGRFNSQTESIEVTFNAIAGAYFETLSINLLKGQGLDGLEYVGAPSVVVISRELETALFRGEEALGRNLVLTPWPDRPRRIVGVVEGVAQGGFERTLAPTVYLPFNQVEGQTLPHIYVMARGEFPPENIAADLKDAIMSLDPSIAPSDLSSMESRLSRIGRPWATATWVVTLVGLLALGLALSGVYAATSGFVIGQASEAGVRSALGAGPLRLIWFLSQRGAVCLAPGIFFGLAGGIAMVRVARTTLPWEVASGAEAAVGVSGIVFVTAGIAIMRPVLSTVRRHAMELIQHGLSGRRA